MPKATKSIIVEYPGRDITVFELIITSSSSLLARCVICVGNNHHGINESFNILHGMILERVNSSQDLKQLSKENLKKLSGEIRELMVDVVSRKGGHLASSLGVVELCVALHYCLNTPEDTLIFDVGHQTYAHKIITGRRDSFSKLRDYNGICGFPDPRESKYDTYLSGHASTAISWAQGIAEAKKIKGDDSKTAAVIGDGALTGGMSFEALNHCGHLQSDVLVILNHNEMSISKSVGALSKYLTKVISAPVYNRIKKGIEKI